MKLSTIRRHLSPYGIYAKRATTINHAFSSALAPVETWDQERAAEAMALLGQSDLNALRCVYCDELAQTWDHLEPMVKSSLPSGFGHTLGNLVPACRDCNGAKGNRPWREWIASWPKAPRESIDRLERYVRTFLLSKRTFADWERDHPEKVAELRRCWDTILEAMKEADRIVEEMRNRGT